MTKQWEPTPHQLSFVNDLIETNFENVTESYRKAYPDASAKWASQEAYHLLRNKHIKSLIEQIQGDLRNKFVLLAPAALERLMMLAENADSEKVMLEANKEILDRAGLKAPERVEFQNLGVFGSAKPEDIKKSIKDKLIVKEKTDEALKS